MSEVLHATALVPATLGVCCTIGDRRRAVEVSAGVLMVVAMADLALGPGLVSPTLWAVAMFAAAALLAVVRSHHADGMVVMGLMAALQAHHGHGAAATAGAARIHVLYDVLLGSALPLWLMLVVCWYVLREERRIRAGESALSRGAIWESRLMSAAVILMVTAHLVAMSYPAGTDHLTH